MGYLRNLPTEEVKNLASLITSKKNQIVSMNISNSDQLQISLFTFADGETISEEEYYGDTMYLVIEGETYITQGEQKYYLKTGDTLMVPANTSHEVGGKGAFKLLQITVSE
ncbi:cupin domain-containing protein [Konateibacter massiliensis]|uniref:cupin domain-containing protein n=1 Tax=Konateibacter massiliensis TaxID=2002841 RepID=UPI000C1605AE|nr:cupin domain-containing protein [Konateibacter massiliensis]